MNFNIPNYVQIYIGYSPHSPSIIGGQFPMQVESIEKNLSHSSSQSPLPFVLLATNYRGLSKLV